MLLVTLVAIKYALEEKPSAKPLIATMGELLDYSFSFAIFAYSNFALSNFAKRRNDLETICPE